MSLLAEQTPECIAISRTGGALLVAQNAASNHRPFLHPIAAPDGLGTLTEDAPPHHPWQHGLYVGLNDVVGVGFWTEGRQKKNAPDGTFHPRPLNAAAVQGDRASWTVVSDWRDQAGKDVLVETQAWSLHDRGDLLELDLGWTLCASRDLVFGQYAYGGLFLRMPYRDRGSVLTSAGHREQQLAEAQPAQWVAVAMPIPDRPADAAWAGIAILDHPANPAHPAPWRVDHQCGIAPSRCIAGAWSLPTGAATTSRYRIVIHAGPTSEALVAAAWHRYTA